MSTLTHHHTDLPPLETIIVPLIPFSRRRKKQRSFSDDCSATIAVDGKRPVSKLGSEKSAHRIHFDEEDDVMETLHVHDYTNEEITAVWLSQSDFQNSVREALRDDSRPRLHAGFLLRSFNRRENNFQPMPDSRGQQLLYDSISKVQKFEKSRNVRCQGLISDLCIKYSEESVCKAQASAIADIEASGLDSN